MNSTIPRTIEEPSLDTDKVGTLERAVARLVGGHKS